METKGSWNESLERKERGRGGDGREAAERRWKRGIRVLHSMRGGKERLSGRRRMKIKGGGETRGFR